MPQLTITPSQLPIGFCPTDFQSMWNGFAAAGSVTIPDTAEQIIASPNKPADQSVVWLQLDSLSRPIRFYVFAQGAWLSMHTLAPGHVMLWFAPLPDFTTFDGGDSNAPGPTSGPMWQQAKDFNGNLITARFPIAAGTLPSGTGVGQSGYGGQERVTLSSAEGAQNPLHKHVVGKFLQLGNDDAYFALGADTSSINAKRIQGQSGGDTEKLLNDASLTGPVMETDVPANAVSTVSSHDNMPPWVGCYFLQRTAKLYYSVT